MGGVIGGNAISPNFGNGGGAELFSQRIETRIGSVKLIPLNTTIGTAIEIMKFKITKVSGVDKDFYNIFEQAQAEMKRTAGAGFVNCFLESISLTASTLSYHSEKCKSSKTIFILNFFSNSSSFAYNCLNHLSYVCKDNALSSHARSGFITVAIVKSILPIIVARFEADSS